MPVHVLVDEKQTPLSCEPEWIQESLARFMSTTNLENLQLTRFVLQVSTSFNTINYFLRLDWVQWQGSKYCCGDFVWHGYQEELPKFGRIYDIIIVEAKAFLCFEVYNTK